MNRHNISARDVFDGVLLVDKPPGPTSHDIVDLVRRRFRFDKVGHGGTLDPQATGLLVMLIGRGTKLSNIVMTSDKTYEGFMRLGLTTDSQDATGKVLTESDASAITLAMVEQAAAAFRGDIMQMPPMVSAVKKGGTALYKLARKGKTVEREAKLVHVYELNLLGLEAPRVQFVMRCSKGTYVRTICHDIGQALGCGAILDQLRRTRSGAWSVADAVTSEQLLNMDMAQLLERIIPMHKVGA